MEERCRIWYVVEPSPLTLVEGEWVDGKRDGYGMCVWDDGSNYAGEWKENLRHGNLIYSSYFHPILGKGIQTDADGTRYVGKWKEDKRQGKVSS